MKTFFAKALIAVALILSASFASAATCAYNPNNGVWYGADPSCGGYPMGNVPMFPIQGNPGMFNAGGNLYRCPALASWGGGILGAFIGSQVGKNIDSGRLRGLTTLFGAMAGNQISCELVRPNNFNAQVPGAYGNFPQGFQTRGSGFAQAQQPNRITVPSDCDIEGHPELQNLKALTEAQCAAVAKLAAHKVVAQGEEVFAQTSFSSMPPVVQISGVQRPKFCTINTGENVYNFNAVNGVKFGKDQCDRYLNKIDQLPPKESMSIVP